MTAITKNTLPKLLFPSCSLDIFSFNFKNSESVKLWQCGQFLLSIVYLNPHREHSLLGLLWRMSAIFIPKPPNIIFFLFAYNVLGKLSLEQSEAPRRGMRQLDPIVRGFCSNPVFHRSSCAIAIMTCYT